MLKRLKHMIEELGGVTAFLYILHRLCAASRLPLSVYCYRLVAQPVSPAHRLTKARRAAFSCRRLDPGDRALAFAGLSQDLCNRRFKQGAQCYGLFREDRLCAWLWYVAHAYEEDEVRCRFQLPDETVWDFDVYVKPEQRLGFAFAALWDLVDVELRKQNVKWCISRISAFNLPSRRSHARLGAVDMGAMVFITAGSVQLMLQKGHPRFHLSLSKAAHPIVRVKTPDDEEAHWSRRQLSDSVES